MVNPKWNSKEECVIPRWWTRLFPLRTLMHWVHCVNPVLILLQNPTQDPRLETYWQPFRKSRYAERHHSFVYIQLLWWSCFHCPYSPEIGGFSQNEFKMERPYIVLNGLAWCHTDIQNYEKESSLDLRVGDVFFFQKTKWFWIMA